VSWTVIFLVMIVSKIRHAVNFFLFVEITRDFRKKLAKARTNQAQIAVVNMKNDKYRSEIMGGATTLAKEHDQLLASLKAEDIGLTLLEQFKSSGARYFFMHLGDQVNIKFSEALEKIIKDIKEQARELRNGSNNSPLVINDGSFEDTVISSTRKKRKSTSNSTIQCTPREYMAHHVRDILPDHGWTVRRKSINGLDVRVASRGRPGIQGPWELVGYDHIIEETYLSGFYETHVVETKNGREMLEKAGILDEPYSIFSEELKRKRKRRKHNQEQTVGLRSETGNEVPTRRNISNEDHSSSLEENGLNIDVSMANGNTHEPETQSYDRVVSNSEETPERGAETVTRTSPDAGLRALLGGTAQVLTSTPDSAESPADGDINRRHNMRHESVSERGAETMATAMQRKKQARQIYKCIKERLSTAEKCSNENAETNVTLQCTFYSHMKSWLVPRAKTVLESDLKVIQNSIDDFETAITELQESGNDKDDIIFYTSCCEDIIEECKKAFLL